MRIMPGLDVPTVGKFLFEGADVTGRPPRPTEPQHAADRRPSVAEVVRSATLLSSGLALVVHITVGLPLVRVWAAAIAGGGAVLPAPA
jgi:hypothetical protein